MGHCQSTAKVSKASKNSSHNKGQLTEQKVSETFHSKGVGLLISSKTLRARGCGQVDIARILKINENLIIEVGEVKSSIIARKCVTIKQLQRLKKTLTLIASVFSKQVRLVIIDGAEKGKDCEKIF